MFTQTFADHISHVDEILNQLRDSGLKLEPSNGIWAQESAKFLGHFLSGEGIWPDPETRAINHSPIPTQRRVTEGHQCCSDSENHNRRVRCGVLK
jgi:hypothetical protein